VLANVTQTAITRAQFSGAKVKVLAIAAVRSTREVEMASTDGDGAKLACIAGVPLPGERLGDRVFDGSKEVAVFPGDLPEAGAGLGAATKDARRGDVRFLRFRPPVLRPSASEPRPAFPHIRLDRLLDFLIGDRLT
jgi:uncharacterized protein